METACNVWNFKIKPSNAFEFIVEGNMERLLICLSRQPGVRPNLIFVCRASSKRNISMSARKSD